MYIMGLTLGMDNPFNESFTFFTCSSLGTAQEFLNWKEFCSCVGEQEYVKANKAYMDIVMGARKWQGDVPYLVEGNRNGPSVVQNVAERINKINSNPLDTSDLPKSQLCFFLAGELYIYIYSDGIRLLNALVVKIC